MANTSAIWQQAAHTTNQLSSPSCSTRATQKSLALNETYLRVFWKQVRRMDHQQKNDKTERARGLGRRKTNKRGDKKGESNESPEIPDRRKISDIPGLPTGVKHKYNVYTRFQGFIELFAPGGQKAKLHSHTTFFMNKYMITTNK